MTRIRQFCISHRLHSKLANHQRHHFLRGGFCLRRAPSVSASRHMPPEIPPMFQIIKMLKLSTRKNSRASLPNAQAAPERCVWKERGSAAKWIFITSTTSGLQHVDQRVVGRPPDFSIFNNSMYADVCMGLWKFVPLIVINFKYDFEKFKIEITNLLFHFTNK